MSSSSSLSGDRKWKMSSRSSPGDRRATLGPDGWKVTSDYDIRSQSSATGRRMTTGAHIHVENPSFIESPSSSLTRDVLYLHTRIGSLRNELQFLYTELEDVKKNCEKQDLREILVEKKVDQIEKHVVERVMEELVSILQECFSTKCDGRCNEQLCDCDGAGSIEGRKAELLNTWCKAKQNLVQRVSSDLERKSLTNNLRLSEFPSPSSALLTATPVVSSGRLVEQSCSDSDKDINSDSEPAENAVSSKPRRPSIEDIYDDHLTSWQLVQRNDIQLQKQAQQSSLSELQTQLLQTQQQHQQQQPQLDQQLVQQLVQQQQQLQLQSPHQQHQQKQEKPEPEPQPVQRNDIQMQKQLQQCSLSQLQTQMLQTQQQHQQQQQQPLLDQQVVQQQQQLQLQPPHQQQLQTQLLQTQHQQQQQPQLDQQPVTLLLQQQQQLQLQPPHQQHQQQQQKQEKPEPEPQPQSQSQNQRPQTPSQQLGTIRSSIVGTLESLIPQTNSVSSSPLSKRSSISLGPQNNSTSSQLVRMGASNHGIKQDPQEATSSSSPAPPPQPVPGHSSNGTTTSNRYSSFQQSRRKSFQQQLSRAAHDNDDKHTLKPVNLAAFEDAGNHGIKQDLQQETSSSFAAPPPEPVPGDSSKGTATSHGGLSVSPSRQSSHILKPVALKLNLAPVGTTSRNDVFQHHDSEGDSEDEQEESGKESDGEDEEEKVIDVRTRVQAINTKFDEKHKTRDNHKFRIVDAQSLNAARVVQTSNTLRRGFGSFTPEFDKGFSSEDSDSSNSSRSSDPLKNRCQGRLSSAASKTKSNHSGSYAAMRARSKSLPAAKSNAQMDAVRDVEAARQAFLGALLDAPPAKTRPLDKKPDHVKHLKTATLNGVIRHMEMVSENWPIHQYLSKEIKVTDVEALPWSEHKCSETRHESATVKKELERRICYQLPFDKIPAAISYLVKVPKSSATTSVCSLCIGVNEVILIQNTCTHEAPFGDRFWVQETSVFSSVVGKSGIRYEKWAEVVDMGSGMPAVIKAFVEKTSKEKSKGAFIFLAGLLDR